MSRASKLKDFALAVLAAGTFLGVVFGAIALVENVGDRSVRAMLVIWSIALAVSTIGCLLFVIANYLLFMRIRWFGSTRGFVAIGAIFGALLGGLWVLRHELLFGVQPYQYPTWSILGASTGLIAAFVWRHLQRHDFEAVPNA